MDFFVKITLSGRLIFFRCELKKSKRSSLRLQWLWEKLGNRVLEKKVRKPCSRILLSWVSDQVLETASEIPQTGFSTAWDSSGFEHEFKSLQEFGSLNYNGCTPITNNGNGFIVCITRSSSSSFSFLNVNSFKST